MLLIKCAMVLIKGSVGIEAKHSKKGKARYGARQPKGKHT